MKIVVDYPPMFDQIDAVFHVKGKPVIFAWGVRIFNPQNIEVGPELLAHEEVHGTRQLEQGVYSWWKRYLDDPEFRLVEEAHAHWAEYHFLFTRGNRQQRKAALKQTAKRLSAPLYMYGDLINAPQARTVLLELDQQYRRLVKKHGGRNS